MKYLGLGENIIFEHGKYYLVIDNVPTDKVREFIFIGKYDEELHRISQIYSLQLNRNLDNGIYYIFNDVDLPEHQIILPSDEFFELTKHDLASLICEII